MANESKIEKCGLLEYHKAGLKGQGKTIVVLDEPPHLRETMSEDVFSAPLGWRENDVGCKGHAAYCAQVIHEAAPEAKVVMLPFMNKSDREQSMVWLREHKGEYDILNMSFASVTGRPFWQELSELPAVSVAAAGNKAGGGVTEPASLDWTIAVGGYVEGTEQIYADNSQGETMDCLAYTFVEVETKPNKWVPFSGTSCASPWLAGMLACYYTNAQTPDVNEVRDLIKTHCIDVADEGKDNESGWGFFKMPTLAEREELMAKTEIIMQLGKTNALVNGEEKLLDVAPFAQDGRTFVPIRFVAEALGCKVDYSNGTITITKD